MEALWLQTVAAAEASVEPTAMPTLAAPKAVRSLIPSPQYMQVLCRPYIQQQAVCLCDSFAQILLFTCCATSLSKEAQIVLGSAEAAKKMMADEL